MEPETERSNRGYGMLLPFVLAAVVVVVVGYAVARGRSGRPPGARMVCEVTRRDVGKLDAGESVTISYPFRNAGADTLRIEDVDVDCGCVKPRFPREVKSGERGEIAATFQALPGWSGVTGRNLRVFTNDPRQKHLPQRAPGLPSPVNDPALRDFTLTVTADVIPLLKLDPPSPLLVPYERGKTYRRTVRLLPRAGTNARATVVVRAAAPVKATLRAPDPKDPLRAQRLDLVIGPNPNAGDFTAQVQLATNQEKLPQVTLEVVGQARTGAVVTPPDLYFGSVAPGTPKALGNLNVFTRDQQRGLRVLGVETSDPKVRADFQTIAAGRFYTVTLHYQGGWPRGVASGTLTIRTDDKEAPLLKARYSGMVTEAAPRALPGP